VLQRVETEKLKLSKRLQESHDEMMLLVQERDDLQGLHKVLQSEHDQLTEHMREITAKVGFIFSPCVFCFVLFCFSIFLSEHCHKKLNLCKNELLIL
jgi:hypothetical protein